MDVPIVAEKETNAPEFLLGGGEMGQRIREYDWSKTSLGPVSNWPQSLRTCIRIMLTSRQPIWIGWGKDLIKFYNDPYKAIVGGKHPWALGTPASIVWKDIWKDIEPMLKQVMEKDEGTYVESQLLIMERNGYPEETYYTFSYTPIPGDDGKTEGMFCANTDDTEKITSERQLRTLTQLGKSLADCHTSKEVIEKTITTLEENPYDFPFALFRNITDNKAVLTHSTPLGDACHVVPKEVLLSSGSPIAQSINKAIATRKPQLFEDLLKRVGRLPTGAWEVPADKCIVLPISQTVASDPYGILVVGLNPHRLPDEKYSSFFSLVADQVATSFADVHVLEEERKRAEALAEIDRAKTIFFSNISHEFRTPLTLILGPIEDVLNDPATADANKVKMDVAYRNALRMQKLVNTLLEFSRIEAGRMEGRFTNVDLCALTQDLASTFRSAIEKAGMQLVFDCQKIQNEVYVDIEMWEKIVLNLLSNAFKYSTEGTISIKITEDNGQVRLSVSDTGIGIPPTHFDKIFDRFHRIENLQGRSQEGTGIGLAMVKELVKIHKGSIQVQSQPGKGSTFTVSIPAGSDHLPAEKIFHTTHQSSAPSSGHADAYIQEAIKWIPVHEAEHPYATTPSTTEARQPALPRKPLVLLADDNADIRTYVKRLLSCQFEVITAVDGEDAYRKMLQFKPDLLLSDIMMPQLDGVGLLQKVRSRLELKNIPVIFLSARAGEEAKVEGLDAGADDYLVKPFTAKELMARVEANIKISKSRQTAQKNLETLFQKAPVGIAILKGNPLQFELVNDEALKAWDKTYSDVIGKSYHEVFPEMISLGHLEELQSVMETGRRFIANERAITFIHSGQPVLKYFNYALEPLQDEEGKNTGVMAVGIDVTEMVRARKKIEESEKELKEMANAMPQLVWVARPDGEVTYYNDRLDEFAINTRMDGNGVWQEIGHAADLEDTLAAWHRAVELGTIYQAEHRLKMKDGTYRWFLSRALPHKNEQDQIIKWFGTTTDIHASKEQSAILEEEVKKRTSELNELNSSLQKSNHELQQFAHVTSHDLKEPLRKIKTFTSRLAAETDGTLSEKAKTFIDKINSAAERMNIMIEGVLHYSILNATEQKIEPVDLNEVLRHIESDLELPFTQKEACLSYHQLPSVEGAAVLLYQLFYNLVNNSLKFTKPGIAPLIEVRTSVVQNNGVDMAVITLTDNGIGFDQALASKIFETFTRLNSKDRFEGTGLGLSLCKRITERHGGSIEAFGEPGQGASFVIQLPLKQERKRI